MMKNNLVVLVACQLDLAHYDAGTRTLQALRRKRASLRRIERLTLEVSLLEMLLESKIKIKFPTSVYRSSVRA